jgi:hypothetical protein
MSRPRVTSRMTLISVGEGMGRCGGGGGGGGGVIGGGNGVAERVLVRV